MQLLIGWGTILGALACVLLSILSFLLLRARVYNTLSRDTEAYKPSREEVAEIFELQGFFNLFANGDSTDANGTRRINWFHRAFVFLNMIKYPLLLGAGVGFILENALNLFL